MIKYFLEKASVKFSKHSLTMIIHGDLLFFNIVFIASIIAGAIAMKVQSRTLRESLTTTYQKQ
jgi:hypothetical protein